MIFDDRIELHNVAEVRQADRLGAYRMQRVPEQVRLQLNPGAQGRAHDPAGCELRFVPGDQPHSITLSAEGDGTDALLFMGDIDTQVAWKIGREPVEVSAGLSEDRRLRMVSLPPKLEQSLPFSPRVARIRFSRHNPVSIHRVAGELRPPSPEEVPSRTLLAYGTSITQGANAGRPYLDWPSQAAWRLGWNLINLGMSGSCHAEAAFGDHIAAREDWDVAVLSLSVNMIGAGFTVAEFRSRVEYIIRTVSSRHPNKPVVCISIFPYFGDWDLSLQPNAAAPPDAFRDALADVASAVGTPNVHFIDGRTLLSGPAGLTADLIHPSDLGMIEIGEGVARRIRELLGR